MRKLQSGTQIGTEEEIKALGNVTGPLYHYTKQRDAVMQMGFLGGRTRSQGDGVYFMDDPKNLEGWTGTEPIKAYIVGNVASISRNFAIPDDRKEDVREEFGTLDMEDLIEPGTLGDFLRFLGYDGWEDGYQYAALKPSAIAIVESTVTESMAMNVVDRLIEGVNWNRSGIGSVPKQVDIDYFGFTRMMTVSAFQRLAPPGVTNKETYATLKPKADAGEKIAPPFLLVDWVAEHGVWQVTGHEGRSRSRLASGDERIPVDVIPRSVRARDLTPEMMNASILPQRY